MRSKGGILAGSLGKCIKNMRILSNKSQALIAIQSHPQSRFPEVKGEYRKRLHSFNGINLPLQVKTTKKESVFS
jgi:hypothetical protein